MATYAAFLRGLNVGGHRVKMDVLRGLFEGLGFTDVASYIASGNIVFTTGSDTAADALTQQIEAHLESSLGYGVATFLRTFEELDQVVHCDAFADRDSAARLLVIFMAAPLPPERQEAVRALCRPQVDEIHFHDREIYWACQGPQHESKLSGPGLLTAVGSSATIRNINTLRKMNAKFNSAGV